MKRFFRDLIITITFALLAGVLIAVTGSQILGTVFWGISELVLFLIEIKNLKKK